MLECAVMVLAAQGVLAIWLFADPSTIPDSGVA